MSTGCHYRYRRKLKIHFCQGMASRKVVSVCLLLAISIPCSAINYCDSATSLCPKFSKCEELPGGYQCVCPKDGFKAIFDNKGKLSKCDNINECENKTTPVCSTNGSCTDTIGKYYCTCLAGYYGNGVVCKQKVTCEPGCDKNAFCEEFGGKYNCRCKSGYEGTGTTCTSIRYCDRAAELCPKSSKCEEISGGYQCAPVGFGYSQANDCPANSVCAELNTPGKDKKWYNCTCKDGYKFNETTRICDDVNECTEKAETTCPQTANCTNTSGSYRCRCPVGFRYKDNQCLDRDECMESGGKLCLPFGTCVNTVGSYTCDCLKGYRSFANHTVCQV